MPEETRTYESMRTCFPFCQRKQLTYLAPYVTVYFFVRIGPLDNYSWVAGRVFVMLGLATADPTL